MIGKVKFGNVLANLGALSTGVYAVFLHGDGGDWEYWAFLCLWLRIMAADK